MARKAKAAAVRCPDEVRTELITVAVGDTRYWFLFDDATVETMASGILPEAIAQQCYMALEWKREQYRVEAHRKAEIAPLFASEATTRGVEESIDGLETDEERRRLCARGHGGCCRPTALPHRPIGRVVNNEGDSR